MNLVPQSTTRLKPAARPDTSSLRGILDTIAPFDPFAAARVLGLTVKAAPGASCRACLHLPSATLLVDFGEGLTDADINEAVRHELERVLRPCVEEEAVVSRPTVATVPFHGDELLAHQDERGVWVVFKRVCEALGLGYASQTQKLKGKPWAVVTTIVTTGSDGKNYEMLAIHLDALPMWLATIDAARVAPSVREKIERYQVECARVLRDHFFGRPTMTRRSDDPAGMVQSLRAEVRELRQAMAAGFRALAGHLDGVAL